MGSTGASEEHVAQTSPSGETTFEAFVENAIQKIQKEAWGRSTEVVEIRNACQTFFDLPKNQETSSTLGTPLNDQRTRAALKPLKLACSCSIARIVEPALGCLHKLVAYAWIQGESSETGNMDDGTLVTEIVGMVVKSVQLNNASIYLSVIRALLTFATADHFIAHGHCLLHMVRTVFNLAVSSDDNNLKRTACNALLQMLNTVVKRVVVTQFQQRSHGTRSIDSTHETMEFEESASSRTESPVVPSPSSRIRAGSGTWKLADLAEKQDIEALEAAFEDKQRVMEESFGNTNASAAFAVPTDTAPGAGGASQSNDRPSASPTASKSTKRRKGWDQLTLLEKDVLIVLVAFCKLAGVNRTAATSENFVRHGKLLALELLVKVFENPGHRWENVRLTFCEQLRFPLCLVLIRNCNPAETKAFQFAIRLFVSVIMQHKIRLGLKAELGALYPLLLLRPLEAATLDPALLTVTLTGVKRISKEPQLQVDLFINYDCNLKAPNLYERTAKALSRLAMYGDPNAPSSQSTLLREAATACSMAMLTSLDSWAGPVRDAANVMHSSRSNSLSGNENGGNGSVIGTTSEVRHFGAAKEKKNSLSIGTELFNKSPTKGIASLVATGIVLNKPDAIASFLRKNREQLDPTMLGEYLGLHDDMPLKVMHAYIDMEQYQNVTIDGALRKLLAQFRLPGEAQKIDRIMEKFAERYCQDNPNVFQSADDAYVLSFSLIMLNTDMHNPMAEKRLTKQDFVSMNMRQNPEGLYVEVLPVVDLEAMYDRIAAEEIRTMHSKPGPSNQREEALAQHRNLAQAVGLTQLALPFRSGRVWDKIRGAQIEHEHLLAFTQKAMRNDANDSDLWFTATHTEHSRPMFEVVGPHFQKTLATAVEWAIDKDSAERAVDSLVMAIQLAALLGLDTLCQSFVTTLARSIGVHSKEALLRANPHRQIAALRALIGVASDEHAGLLGSSWTIILRAISAVEALISDMRRGHNASNSVFEESMQTIKIHPPLERRESDKSTAISRFFSQIGLSKGEVENYISIQPGQAIRLWADGEGITEMDRVFVRSASLGGDAVVVFCKALCIVSNEELNPATPHPEGATPRVFSLRKLVECAYYNLGRIRLIWGRLWSIISSHLVTASCHSDQTVAMYSVDSLRQLVGKLLSRDELANFTTQSDTLRPFVTVLRHCANVVVRELAVQCIEQAMNAHSNRLGSGWIVVLEFMTVASLDPAPSVTRQCVETLQSIIDVHWRKWGRGRDALADCVNVALRVARNPHNSDCSLRAIQLIFVCAEQLVSAPMPIDRGISGRSASVDYADDENDAMTRRAASEPERDDDEDSRDSSLHAEPLLSTSSLWIVIFESLVEIITREDRRRCADSAAEVLFKLPFVPFTPTWDQQTWHSFQTTMHSVFDLKECAYSMESDQDRILSYSTSFLPGLFTVIRENYQLIGKSLLAHVLEILMGWMQAENQAMALSGAYLLREMIEEISDHLDDEGWSIMVGRLRCAWNTCVRHDVSQENERLPFVSWIEGETPIDASGIRIRCQVLVVLLRILSEILDKHMEKIPENLMTKLIEILLDAVRQTSEVNNDSAFLIRFQNYFQKCQSREKKKQETPPEEEEEVVETPPTEKEEVPEMPSASSTHDNENEEDATKHTEEEIHPVAEEEAKPLSESLSEDLPTLETEFSQMPSLAAELSWEHFQEQESIEPIPKLAASLRKTEGPSFSGFLKLYVEGGMLTIDALLKKTTDDSNEDRTQLLDFCRNVIVQASTETRDLVKCIEDGVELSPLHSQWRQAVKAPLISKALDAYQSIEGELFVSELQALVPHFSTLICNPQPSIRRAVSNLMKRKTALVLHLEDD